MKRLQWMTATMVALISSAVPYAANAADETPWYVGAGVGHGDVQRPGSWAERTGLSLSAQGVTSATTVSTGNTAWKVFGGYQIDENFGVEAAYARLGKFGSTTIVTAPAAGTGTGKWDASAFSVAGVGTLPIHENRVSLFGKLGLTYARLDVNVIAPNGATNAIVNNANGRASLMMGVGIRFDLTKKVGLRAEYEYFNNVGDSTTTGQSGIAVWSISGQYKF